MELAVRSDFCGNDMDRLAEYAATLGVRNVMAFPAAPSCYDKSGLMRDDLLSAYKEQFEERGLRLCVLSETILNTELVSESTAAARAEKLCATVQAMAQAGLDTLFVYLHLPCSDDAAEKEALWEHLVSCYRRVIRSAEELHVRIASHGQQEHGYLIWTYDQMQRLLQSVPSDYNGVTFCTGCYGLAGDDLPRCIRSFGKKIFLVHARDVVRKPDGFAEVMYDQGEVDLFEVLRELREAGYSGLVCPEHLPKVAHDLYEETPIAWALGYLTAALKALTQAK